MTFPRRPARVLALTCLLLAALPATAVGGPAVAGAAHAKRPSALRPVTIHPIGDSITLGTSRASFSTPGGYRVTLRTALESAGIEARYAGTNADNAPAGVDPTLYAHDGWGGRRIEEMTASLLTATELGGGNWLVDTAARPAIDADVTVVMAGMNDVLQHFDPQHPAAGAAAFDDPAQRAVFVADAAARLATLVRTIHALDRDTSIVLCTNVPLDAYYADGTTRLDVESDRRLNALIRGPLQRRLVAEGIDLQVADVEKDFRAKSGTDLIDDGIHPTPAGYAVLGRTVSRAVVKLTAR